VVSLLAILPPGFWIKGKSAERDRSMELIAYQLQCAAAKAMLTSRCLPEATVKK